MKFLILAVAVVAGVGARSINSGYVLPAGNIGTSGIVRKDGTTELFSHDFAHDIVAIGPAGIVTKSGINLQLDADLNIVRAKRSLKSGYVLPQGNIGTSGILRKDGSTDLFSHDFAHDIVAIGPAGIVTKSGINLQLDADLNIVRAKRSLKSGYVLPQGNIGTSGILRKDGSTDLFSHDFAHDIVAIGPAGIVTKSGKNVQLTDDLRMVTPGRTKRHTIADSGMITSWGHPVQFREPFTTILLEGPSGLILSDGQQIQKPQQ